MIFSNDIPIEHLKHATAEADTEPRQNLGAENEWKMLGDI